MISDIKYKRICNDIEYLSNGDDTVGVVDSLKDAFDMFAKFEYRCVGYSKFIAKRYPLFSVLQTELQLSIPDKVWFAENIAPLIIEYIDAKKVYMIASKIPRSMIE